MITKDAIELLQEPRAIQLAHSSVSHALCSEADDTRGVMALPKDFQVHDLENYLVTRRRQRGTVQTPVAASFAAYVSDHSEQGATVFIDPTQMSATAVLNLGTPIAPGHADNTATFTPPQLSAYRAMREVADGTTKSQQRVAEWMEDWQDVITCLDADGQQIATGKAVAAVRRITIEALRRQESEVAQLRATNSTFEDVQAKSTEPIPARLQLKCVPLHGLPQRTFALRLGIVTGDKQPGLVLRIVRLEDHLEGMAKDLEELVVRELLDVAAENITRPQMVGDAPHSTGVKTVIGTYRRG
jgi:uncharacterized protein YfdQ (DUF2303 family)